jgi:hypothetical protein
MLQFLQSSAAAPKADFAIQKSHDRAHSEAPGGEKAIQKSLAKTKFRDQMQEDRERVNRHQIQGKDHQELNGFQK